MKKYHVHVYKIVEKAEMNVEAKNEIEAKEKALSEISKLKFSLSDCNYIAMEFEY